MTVHVFAGPTLPHEEVRRILPDAVAHPPVSHLDVLRLDAGPGDVVALVDGVFFQVASVRHKEILWLLRQGVTVCGSSSMGALRAAELAPFGMRGVGQVFQAYASGRLEGDDEVAIAHADTDAGWRALSDPMVNVRTAVDRAVAAEVISRLEGHAIVETGRAMFFPYRRLDRIVAACVAGGLLPAARAEDFRTWAAAHPWDAKREDALLLLELIGRGGWAVRPPDADDRPAEGFTPFVTSWLAAARSTEIDGARVSDEEVSRVLRLFAPDAAEHVARRGHALLAGQPLAGAGQDPSAEAEVVDRARQRCAEQGLLGEEGLSAECLARHLTPAEHTHLALPDQQLLAAARIAAVETVDDTRPPRDPAALRAAAGAARLNEELAQRGEKYRPSHIAAATVDRLFADWWQTDDLATESLRRGFADLRAFREAARFYLPYALEHGVPAVSMKEQA